MSAGGRPDPEPAGRPSAPHHPLAWLGADDPETLAPIHATVELERALRELVVPATARREAPDPLLGAEVAVLDLADGRRVALAEPSTEGRLAAFLARHGEGPAGRYVRSPVTLAEARRRATRAGLALSRPADGPFGRAVLVLGGPTDRATGGPHLILVGPAAVPSRP